MRPSYLKRIADRHAVRDADRERVWAYARRAGLFSADEAAAHLGMNSIYVGRLLAELRVEKRLTRRVVRNCTSTVEYEVIE